ncbi:transcriptional regulator [Vibrio rumoiensis]|uniref:OmpR/PhoB-type domain-containing protein n=1 Tax=Vibrio rumoiensis 1S-45 TaxID=1188252 RepID=A0A1E5E0L2_9VIBR|nr:transcriptional regulator [Vibrio rumoiensis]OEF24004.1 hypothetical protein A1QC_02310 [Vibrio rumoiensis 1S-45]
MTNIGTKYILAQKLIFDPYSNTLIDQTNDNDVIRLGSNESRILLILIENSTSVVSRDQLHEYVWRDQGFQVDDSSLTQAISTLRKMLQDSTKSPQYVKTVPKRGYQLIAQVEVASPLSATEPLQDESELDKQPDTISNQDNSLTVDLKPEIPVTPQEASPTKTKVKTPLGIKLIWLVILLLPVLSWVLSVPKSTEFTQLTKVENVPVLVPDNQSPLDDWVPIIKRCTELYLSKTPDKETLIQVIATGGQRDHVSLNYIHSLDLSNENRTILLFVDQTNFDSLCQ